MELRVIGRRDGLLWAGFALALVTVFDRPMERFLSIVSEIDAVYGIRLAPALLVLMVILIIHLYAKRQDMKAAAIAAFTEARVTAERARDLEQLAAFGRALSVALEYSALEPVLWRGLPELVEGRELWVALGDPPHFDLFLETTGDEQIRTTVEQLAGDVLEGDHVALGQLTSGMRVGDYHCVPVTAGVRVMGAIGVRVDDGALSARTERTFAAAAVLVAIAARNVQLFLDSRTEARTDALTGCFNRTHILKAIDTELRRSRRTRSPVSAIMLDLDNFKEMNDRLGHLAGDEALATVAERLRDVLRSSDVRGRFGGDEFVIVLPDTPAAGAAHVGEALRREIQGLAIKAHPDAVVTASVGVATATDFDTDPMSLVGRADAAMYAAKAGGGNQVNVANSKPGTDIRRRQPTVEGLLRAAGGN